MSALLYEVETCLQYTSTCIRRGTSHLISTSRTRKRGRTPIASRLALGSTQLPIQRTPVSVSPGDRKPMREADYSPPSSAQGNNTCCCITIPLYTLNQWCLTKLRENLSFSRISQDSKKGITLKLNGRRKGGKRVQHFRIFNRVPKIRTVLQYRRLLTPSFSTFTETCRRYLIMSCQ